MPAPRAAIFDLDGTLVDNMRFHADAWMALSERLGVVVSRDYFLKGSAGLKNAEIFPFLLKRPIPADELRTLSDEKERLYRELYAPHLAPVPGLFALLDRLDGARTPRAIATLAPRENREFVLGRLRLAERFGCIVGAEQVVRGKPAPDAFLAAAHGLGVDPCHCIAFEDAVNGVLAARAAGMDAVGITTSTPAEELVAAGARWVAADFTALPDELEARLVA